MPYLTYINNIHFLLFIIIFLSIIGYLEAYPINFSLSSQEFNENILTGNLDTNSSQNIEFIPLFLESLKSKMNVSFNEAISIAQDLKGKDSLLYSISIEIWDGLVVYSIKLFDTDKFFYNVLISPSNGQILLSKRIPFSLNDILESRLNHLSLLNETRFTGFDFNNDVATIFGTPFNDDFVISHKAGEHTHECISDDGCIVLSAGDHEHEDGLPEE